MVPELLSSNLCSLRPDVERFAFSVIWQVTADAEIQKTTFSKSVIRSRRAFTYAEAQCCIDDPIQESALAVSLRGLNKLAKILKKKRMELGYILVDVDIDIDIVVFQLMIDMLCISLQSLSVGQSRNSLRDQQRNQRSHRRHQQTHAGHQQPRRRVHVAGQYLGGRSHFQKLPRMRRSASPSHSAGVQFRTHSKSRQHPGNSKLNKSQIR